MKLPLCFLAASMYLLLAGIAALMALLSSIVSFLVLLFLVVFAFIIFFYYGAKIRIKEQISKYFCRYVSQYVKDRASRMQSESLLYALLKRRRFSSGNSKNASDRCTYAIVHSLSVVRCLQHRLSESRRRQSHQHSPY